MLGILTSTIRRFATAALVSTAALAAAPAQAQLFGGYTQTKYPIVLVHGFIGFDSIIGIDYFYKIPQALRDGGAKVYIAQVNPSQTTEYRGEQLLQQMKAWAAKDGVKKFNIIGHSHGGPTARYVAGVAPSLVASVSTVAGTHFGSKVADAIGANTTPGSGFDQLATAGLQLINYLAGGSQQSVKDTDLLTALAALNTAGATAFNAKFPAGKPTSSCGSGASSVNGIYYYSFSGTSVKTNALDIADVFMDITGKYYGTEANDGLVGRCSSHWGKVVKDNYPWNHIDEINHVFGLIGNGAPDPVEFYRQHANRLKWAGI
ncbi:MAG: triacylglycerol lipase [Aquabacterium sp.]|jgi:triacylglycerol lipase|nr:MAG: triacylglycerol lipase [Aquabacterium sp.]